MSDELDQFRQHLVLAEQKSQEDFDKSVISLSGGALGISFAFLGSVVHGKPIALANLLFYAWGSWGVSLATMLVSYFLSIRALRRAIKQIDSGAADLRRLGGMAAIATEICNIVGGTLFLVGLVLIVIFIRSNIPP